MRSSKSLAAEAAVHPTVDGSHRAQHPGPLRFDGVCRQGAFRRTALDPACFDVEQRAVQGAFDRSVFEPPFRQKREFVGADIVGSEKTVLQMVDEDPAPIMLELVHAAFFDIVDAAHIDPGRVGLLHILTSQWGRSSSSASASDDMYHSVRRT